MSVWLVNEKGWPYSFGSQYFDEELEWKVGLVSNEVTDTVNLVWLAGSRMSI